MCALHYYLTGRTTDVAMINSTFYERIFQLFFCVFYFRRSLTHSPSPSRIAASLSSMGKEGIDLFSTLFTKIQNSVLLLPRFLFLVTSRERNHVLASHGERLPFPIHNNAIAIASDRQRSLNPAPDHALT